MEIQIRNQQTSQEINTSSLETILQQGLTLLGHNDKEVSVLLVDDEQIHQLNLQYRQKDSPTDVLAFCQQEDNNSSFLDPTLLGDIVISIPTAQRQAKEREQSLGHELKTLLIHGLLHLLGYDHITDEDAAVMQPKEAELFNLIV